MKSSFITSRPGQGVRSRATMTLLFSRHGLIVFQEKDVNIAFMTEMKGLPANISEVSIL